MNNKWETLIDDTDYKNRLYRVDVPGGWLYRTSVALEFVPYPSDDELKPQRLPAKEVYKFQ